MKDDILRRIQIIHLKIIQL